MRKTCQKIHCPCARLHSFGLFRVTVLYSISKLFPKINTDNFDRSHFIILSRVFNLKLARPSIFVGTPSIPLILKQIDTC